MAFTDTFTDVLTTRSSLAPENRLDLAVADLIRYYNGGGNNSIDNYTTVEDRSKKDYKQPEEVGFTFEQLEKLRSMLTDTTEGAMFCTDIMDKVESELGDVSDIITRLKVYFESNGSPSSPINATVKECDNKGVMEQCGTRSFQALTAEQQSAKAAALKTSVDEANKRVATDNNGSTAPDRITNPYLSAILINDVRLTPANRRSDAGTIFFNSIPTMEMSQCAPFIKLTFVTEGDSFSSGKNSMTLYGFAAGSSDSLVPDLFPSEGVNLYEMHNVGAPQEFDLDAGDFTVSMDEVYSDLDSDLQLSISQASNAGVELFQAPQMLNNLGNSGKVETDGILNPSAPLASLNRLTIDVSGLGLAILANKTASMEILLHDRSQLPLMAPIVGASTFASTYVVIEYGWTHPQATGNIIGNAYADFLNSLRSKGLFNIQVADLSMLEDGQVRINLKLASRGSSEMANVPAACGIDKIPAAMLQPFLSRTLELLTKAQTSFFSEQMEAMIGAASTDEAVLAAVTEMRTALLDVQQGFSAVAGFRSPTALIDIAEYRNLLILLRDNKGAEALKGGADIIKSLVTAMEDVDTSTERYQTLRNVLTGKNKNLAGIDIFNDGSPEPPLLKEQELDQAQGKKGASAQSDSADNNVGSTTSPSLGSILLTYIGRPLQAMGKYDEVQFHFYPFNSHAAWMADTNIATFKCMGFSDFINKIGTNRPAISTSDFAEALFASACGPENKAHPMYGLTEVYSTISPQELKGKSKEERAEIIRQAGVKEGKRLQALYQEKGIGSRLAKFDVPDITMFSECIPAKMADGRTLNTKSILRIHVFDAKSGVPYEAELLNQIIRQGQTAIEVVVDAQQKTSTNGASVQATAESANSARLAALVEEFIENGELAQSDEIIQETGGGNTVAEKVYVSSVSAQKIKDAIKTVHPSITFGTQYSNIKSVGMSSNTGGATNQVLLLNAVENDRSDNDASQPTTEMQEVFVIPTSATVQSMGFPLVEYGQKYYIDMGTGTTADNFYYVVGIRHTFGPGMFDTTLTMAYNGSATVRSLRNALEVVSEQKFP